MSIMETIQRKKNAFFVARDGDKREAQIATLEAEYKRIEKERAETQRVRELQTKIKNEQTQLHELRTQGTRDLKDRLLGGLKSIAKNTQERTNAFPQFEMQPNKESPFYTGGPLGPPKEVR